MGRENDHCAYKYLLIMNVLQQYKTVYLDKNMNIDIIQRFNCKDINNADTFHDDILSRHFLNFCAFKSTIQVLKS